MICSVLIKNYVDLNFVLLSLKDGFYIIHFII